MSSTEQPHPGRLALGAAVVARRSELGLTQNALAARGGLSNQTIRLIERARYTACSPRMFALLEIALQWKPGTAKAIVDGTAPPDPGEWLLPAVVANTVRLDDDQLQQLAQLIAREVAAYAPTGPTLVPSIDTERRGCASASTYADGWWQL